MQRLAIFLAFFVSVISAASAQQGRYSPWFQEDGAAVQGTVMLCAVPGTARRAAPCGSMNAPLNVMVMPYTRSGPDPIIFPNVTTTPQQFEISRPTGAMTYRFVNPCDVDVRIRKVGSMQEQITRTTGTLYLARTVEVVGTSRPQYVSIVAMSEPSKPCNPELGYGTGS